MKDYLILNSFTNYDEILRLNRRNENWLPPRAIGPIEDGLKELEENIRKETRKMKHLICSNLTTLQKTG